MIRLPKIFKKSQNSSDSSYLSRSSEYSNRSRSEEVNPSEITEDPEKQKARHRLLGAAVLVLIAIVGLPKVFDSQPKKINNDVVLQMVASAVEPQKEAPREQEKGKEQKAEVKEPISQPESKVENKSEVPAEPPKKAVDKSLDKGEEVVEEVKPKKQAQANSVKYVLQIGAFSTQEKIKKLGARLKEQKIPYFSEEKIKDDTKLYLMRGGPFTDKAEAEAAEKKVRAMGLTPRLVEVSK
jgi:DedD protein